MSRMIELVGSWQCISDSKVGIVLTILLCVCPSVWTLSCNQVDQCKCTFDDGSGTVDLSPIGKQDGTALLQDAFASDNFAYSYNPCYPFTEGTCANAAACQYDSANVVYYNIGDSSKVDFSYDGLNVIVTYTADDGLRTSIVTLVCDQNTDPPNVQALGESAQTQYSFTLTSKYACPSGAAPTETPPPDTPKTDGPSSGDVSVTVEISLGWILTIVFLGALSTYLIAGMTINKFARHNSGRDIVPNVTLWTALPGLIKDGFTFVYNKIRRRGGYSSY